MAENSLVNSAAPPPNLIDNGKQLLEQLDESQFPVAAALWMADPEPGEWRLIIASPEVRVNGSKQAYRRVQTIVKRLNTGFLSLANIRVIDSDDPLIKLLKLAVRTGPGISGMTFVRNSINGTLFPDSYIYRVV